MKAIVRLAEEKDAEKFVRWSLDTQDNMFTGGTKDYPSLRVLSVDVDDEPAVYAPFHPVMVVESLAHKPGITPRENAYAFRKLQDTLDAMAKHYGMAEIWWQCIDPSLIRFALRYDYKILVLGKPNMTPEETDVLVSKAIELGLPLTLRKKVLSPCA